MRTLALLGLALLAAAAQGAAAQGAAAEGEEEESTCVTCHEVDIDESLAVPVSEWRDSVHAAHWVSCDACHGGDPRLDDGEASMSEEAGFLQLPSWTEMTDHCGVCHEEIAESYAGGHFGHALAAGVRVATCATCHMRDGHRTLEAVPAEIVTADVCPACPSVADPAGTLVMLEELASAEAALLMRIGDVEASGIELSDFRDDLLQAHRDFARAVHEFDEESFDHQRARALSKVSELAERVEKLAAEADRRLHFGFALLGTLALLFAALWMKLQTSD